MKMKADELYELQAIIHRHGCKDFLEGLVQALYNASEEMEDIHKPSSEQYRTTATDLCNLIEETLK